MRQISLGYDTEHDKEHVYGEIPSAAGCYAIKASLLTQENASGWDPEDGVSENQEDNISVLQTFFWPWPESKVLEETGLTIRECLLRSAALIIAEIQRRDAAGLDRPPTSGGANGGASA